MDVKKREREMEMKKEEKKRYCSLYCRCINFYVGDGYDRCSINSGSVLRLQATTYRPRKKIIVERE